MSARFLETLGWLPPSPPDFKERIKALGQSESPGREVRFLATHALDGNQLNRLANALKQLRASHKDLSALTPFRLGLIGNGTLDFLEPALIASAARHGIALECIRAAYGKSCRRRWIRSQGLTKHGPMRSLSHWTTAHLT